jgi:hypothetical protein
MGEDYLAGKEPFVNINNKGLGKVPGGRVHKTHRLPELQADFSAESSGITIDDDMRTELRGDRGLWFEMASWDQNADILRNVMSFKVIAQTCPH